MNRLIKSLSEFLGYLGRGATPVDGMPWQQPATCASGSVCHANADTPQAGSTKQVGSGYRVLM